jgi:tetratricopeptide (TPR) repeat protein
VHYYEQVREVSAATYAAESPALAMADFNLALAYRSAKQHARAQAILDPLIARMLVPGKESWMLAARAIDLSGTLADDRRDYRAAIALRERALAVLSHVDDPANRAYVQMHVGETYTRMKRPDLAISPLEAALAYYAARSDEPYESGVTRYLLAKALWESGRDRPRSMALAKQADDDLARAKSGDELQMFRDEVDRFLATHR